MDNSSVMWYITRMFGLVNFQQSQIRGGQQTSACILCSFTEEFKLFFQGLSNISFNDFLYSLEHLYIRDKYTFGILITVTLTFKGTNYISWLKRLSIQEQNYSNQPWEMEFEDKRWHEVVTSLFGCCYCPFCSQIEIVGEKGSESGLEGRWIKGARR